MNSLYAIARWLGVALIAILSILLLLPLLLLPIASSVPWWLWLPLAILDAACIYAAFRLLDGWQRPAGLLAGLLLIALAAVYLSQALASTPAIVGADGKPLPGSIATLEQVELNGSMQWISIRGHDQQKPVLLFLAGGPGGSQLVTARRTLAELEQYFVVVNWEQPGAGKSFDAVDRATLTPERYVEDGHALALYLLERFGDDKLYVLGESWGSALGIWLVQRDPQLFHAFIGTGQMVNFLETDLACYEFSLDLARERGDSAKVAQLERQGPPPYYGPGTAFKEAAFLMDTFDYMNHDPAIYDDGFDTFGDLAGGEYGLYDKLNWFRGALDTIDIVYPQLWDVDLREQAVDIVVPVYFLLGRHDVNAAPHLAVDYLDQLQAPIKQLVWFEHSGHNPWVTESERFVDVIVSEVLPATLSLGVSASDVGN